jgi:hypothetical protein
MRLTSPKELAPNSYAIRGLEQEEAGMRRVALVLMVAVAVALGSGVAYAGCSTANDRMVGGGWITATGPTIKVLQGMELWCNTTRTSNLQITWDGNYFHLIQSGYNPNCNRGATGPGGSITVNGSGRCNGVTTNIIATFTDNNPDTAAINISPSAPCPGLTTATLPLMGGNFTYIEG